MAKVQKLSELSRSFSFTEYDFFDFYHRSFERSELGRIKKHLPLREMAESFGLVSNRRAPKRGRKPYMKDLDTMYTDAICYESEMRYPTDQKLLWECCERAYKAIGMKSLWFTDAENLRMALEPVVSCRVQDDCFLGQ